MTTANMKAARAILFAGGDPGPLSYLEALDYDGAFLVAVDRGLVLMSELGLIPDMFIGDGDSVPPDLLAKIDSRRTRVVMLPSHKDVSDLEAALDLLTHEGCKGDVLVLAGLGGRLDHTVLNLELASHRMVDFAGIALEDGRCLVRPLTGSNTMRFAPGLTLSFVPMTEGVVLTLIGFEYSLTHAPIVRGSTRTLSNVTKEGIQHVIVEQGTVVMIAWKEPQSIP